MNLILGGLYMSGDGKVLPVVRKSNLLIESICKATTNEKRIIIMGASKVQRDDPFGKTYSFHLSEIKKYSGIQNKRFYKDLEESIISVKRRDLWLKQESGKFELTNWFSWIDYDEEKLTLKFRFDQSVHELLTELGENFTTYLVSNAIALNKAQYITLFELLKSYQYKGNGKKFYRDIEIDYLSERLNLSETGYERFQDLRRFIIEPAVKAINQCTDIFIYKVDYIKTGRKYTSISFYCEPNDHIKMMIENQNTTSTPSEDNPKDDSEQKEKESIDSHDIGKNDDGIKQLLIDNGIVETVADKILHDYDVERIQKNISYTLDQNKKGKVSDRAGYLHNAIVNDYAKSYKPKKEEFQKSTGDQKQKSFVQKEQEINNALEQERLAFEAAISIFESLDISDQKNILDKVEAKLKSLEKARFATSRAAGTAHKERTYALHFKNVLVENGFDLIT